jgi:hypothetical protein
MAKMANLTSEDKFITPEHVRTAFPEIQARDIVTNPENPG